MRTINEFGQKLADLFKMSSHMDRAVSHYEPPPEEKDPLASILPFEAWDEGSGIYINARSVGFCIEVIPLLHTHGHFDEEFAELIAEIGEEGASVQCLLWADHRIDPALAAWVRPEPGRGCIGEGQHTLLRKIRERRAGFFRREMRSPGEIPVRNFRFFFSYGKRGFDIAETAKKKTKVLSFFRRTSHAHDPHPQEWLDTFSGLVNFSGNTDMCSRRYDDGNYLCANLCLPGALEEEKERVLFHKEGKTTAFKSLEAIELPEEWSSSGNHMLLGDFFNASRLLPADFFIHFGMFFPSQDKQTAKIALKTKTLGKQLSIWSPKNLLNRSREEYGECLRAERQIREGKKIVLTRINIGLFSDPAKIDADVAVVRSLYAKFGFKILPCDFIHLDEFVRSLPMVWGESASQGLALRTRMFNLTTTAEVPLFLPIVAEWKGNSPTGIPLTGRRGQFSPWDIFATQGNLNVTVVGSSGTGKSVFMQEIIVNLLGCGGRSFVIDLGRSFEKPCHLLDGQYLLFNKGSDLNLNPFAMVPPSDDGDSTVAFLTMITSIVSTMAMPMKKIDVDRENMIASAVRSAWDREGAEATIDTVANEICDAKYETEMMRSKRESLVASLRKFTSVGEYARYFYGKNRVSFNTPFTVIETEELKNMPDLQAVVLQVFSLMISNEIFTGNRERKSLVAIDEAWDLLKSPQMEGFIESMARRLRKYDGSLLVGTQGLHDFDRSPGAKAAFLNSNWLVLMGRDGETIPYLKDNQVMDVTPHVEEMIDSLKKVDGKYSEAFIYNRQSSFYTVAQLKLDPFSASLYSTNAENFRKINTMRKEGIPVERAIEILNEREGRI